MTADELAAIVREHTHAAIDAALKPYIARIAELEARPMPVGLVGEKGDQGLPGVPGRDGAGISDSFLDRDGHLIVVYSDGRTKDHGNICGRDGIDGKDGRDGIDGKDGAPGLHGKDGADGLNGKDGRDGLDGKAGIDGRDGQDGAPGKDGADGVTLEDAGEWTAGQTYPKGVGVSWDGGYWISKAETSHQPGMSPDWRLAVRRGKQGRDGKQGPPGKDGRDLRTTNTPDLYA